jgi:cell division protein FtsB
MEVTPEEARFLRGFFRRQIMPWAVALLVISVTTSLLLGDTDTAEVEVRTSAAVAQLRSENQKLAAEIERLTSRLETGLAQAESEAGNDLERRLEDAKHNIRVIEARVTAKLERRIDAIEAQVGQGGAGRVATLTQPGPANAAAPPPDASAWDVSQILDRLYAVEMAQQEAGSGSPANGGRLRSLEERVSRLEAAGLSGGTAPAPSSALAPRPSL